MTVDAMLEHRVRLLVERIEEVQRRRPTLAREIECWIELLALVDDATAGELAAVLERRGERFRT